MAARRGAVLSAEAAIILLVVAILLAGFVAAVGGSVAQLASSEKVKLTVTSALLKFYRSAGAGCSYGVLSLTIANMSNAPVTVTGVEVAVRAANGSVEWASAQRVDPSPLKLQPGSLVSATAIFPGDVCNSIAGEGDTILRVRYTSEAGSGEASRVIIVVYEG